MTDDHLESFGWIQLDSFRPRLKRKVRWRDPLTGQVHERWEAILIQFERDQEWRRKNPRPELYYHE